jgi:hypothetical protein
MYNYQHEIEFPQNKAIRYYLWYDYFHDSQISNIEITGRGAKQELFFNPTEVVLTIISICDIDKEKNSKKKPREKYEYLVKFKGCSYFSYSMGALDNVYLNGRFKDSVLLKKHEMERKNKLFHFRIQTVDGYSDIIFANCHIIKKIGTAKPNDCEENNHTKTWMEKYMCDKGYGEISIENLHSLAKTGDDVERFFALDYMARLLKADAIDDARRVLLLDKEEYEMARIAAIWTIGMQGNTQDLPLLKDVYFNDSVDECSESIRKRHALDAIERIMHRHERQGNT